MGGTGLFLLELNISHCCGEGAYKGSLDIEPKELQRHPVSPPLEGGGAEV